MKDFSSSDRSSLFVGGGLLLTFLVVSIWSVWGVVSEAHQGEVYRIIYLHVPSAFSAFLASFALFVFSLLSLKHGSSLPLLYAKATAEVGLLFTVITLATGSIWGKPTWGVWWTWDARLTTTFILALLYCGYLLLWSSLPHGPLKGKLCAVLGVLIFADIPIIYKSVTWWRTLHQPPSLLRNGQSTMAPEILNHLLLCAAVTLLLAVWMVFFRGRNIQLKRQINSAIFRELDRKED